MLYPDNTAARDSIHSYMKNYYPVPDTYKVRSMVLVSGGLDSTALLANILQHTNHEVHAHHVDIRNHENRANAESAALAKVIAYIGKHYRSFTYSTSRYEMMIGEPNRPGPDASVVMFMASRVNFSLGNVHDIFWTGQMRGPMYEFVDAGAVFGACHTFVRQKPLWLMPFENFRKWNLYSSIPPELADLTWTCRFPKYDGLGNAFRCGECHGCDSRARVAAYVEQYKNNKNNPMPQPVPVEGSIDEYPCLYPRMDSHRNIMRCSICKNCVHVLTQQAKTRMNVNEDRANGLKTSDGQAGGVVLP